MRVILFAVAAVFICARPAEAQQPNQWVYITGSETQKNAINAASIVRSGTMLSSWFSRVTRDPVGPTRYNYVLSYYQIDCSGNRLRLMQSAGYRFDGTAVDGLDNPSDWEPAFPESVAESMVRQACTGTFAPSEGYRTVREWVQAARLMFQVGDPKQ